MSSLSINLSLIFKQRTTPPYFLNDNSFLLFKKNIGIYAELSELIVFLINAY